MKAGTMSMSERRFAELADAWGGDLERWPADERLAARAWAGNDPMAAERALFEARQTDAALDAVPRVTVPAALRERVIASAAVAGLRPRAPRGAPWRLLWIGGAGWAAAACAGVVFGTTLSSHMALENQVDMLIEETAVTSFDDAGWLR